MWLRSFFVQAHHNGSTDIDLENQGPRIQHKAKRNQEEIRNFAEPPHANVISVLQTLESKLGRVLEDHMQEIKALHKSATERKEPTGITRSQTQLSGSSTMAERPEDSGTKDYVQGASPINIHVKYLDDFLSDYITNVRRLKERLKNGDFQELTTGNTRSFESIRKQFEMQLLISTFSTGLTVAFGSLVRSLLIQSAHNKKLFDVGLLVCFFTISCHIFIIAISGRSASLTSDSQFTKDHGIEFFHSALATCDHLYMWAIYAFSATLLMMSFAVFENVAYPVAYCGTVALGILVLFASRLRHLLVLYRSVAKVRRLVRRPGSSK